MWHVYWDNPWIPNGSGKFYTRFGDAMNFATKKRDKQSTGLCEIKYVGPTEYCEYEHYKSKERYTFVNGIGVDYCELPDWIKE